MVSPKIFDKTEHLPLIKTLSKLVQETFVKCKKHKNANSARYGRTLTALH